MSKINTDPIITQPEVEALIDALLTDAEFHPYAVYGLMFLFGSIRKLIASGRDKTVDDILYPAFQKLYSQSPNFDKAITRTLENIHLAYRSADFTSDDQTEIAAFFIESEFGKQEEKKDEKN